MSLYGKERRNMGVFAHIMVASLVMLSGHGISDARAQSSATTNVTVTEFSVEALAADAQQDKTDEVVNDDSITLDTTLDLNFDVKQDQVDLISTIGNSDTIAFSADNSTILGDVAEATVHSSDTGISSIDEAVSLIADDTETAADSDISDSNTADSNIADNSNAASNTAASKISGRTDAPTASPLVTKAPKDSVAETGTETGTDSGSDTATDAPAEPLADTDAKDQEAPEPADTDGNATGTALASDTSTISASSDTGQVSLVRTEVPYSGVADVGIDPVQGDSLDRVIWRGTTVDTVIALADPAFAGGGSPALAALADAVIAVRAEQPAEITGRDAELVEARLAWLAGSGPVARHRGDRRCLAE
jgi:hypothetical protein